MLLSCWSSKGGSGTTTIAAGIASVLAKKGETLLLDAVGDLPRLFGAEPDARNGLIGWINAGSDIGTNRLETLSLKVLPTLSIIPAGVAEFHGAANTQQRVDELVDWVGQRSAVVDLGQVDAVKMPLVKAFLTKSNCSMLVIRNCLVALQKAQALQLQATDVVMVEEPGRLVKPEDVRRWLGLEVSTTIQWDVQVAKAVDNGQFARSLPRSLERALRKAA